MLGEAGGSYRSGQAQSSPQALQRELGRWQVAQSPTCVRVAFIHGPRSQAACVASQPHPAGWGWGPRTYRDIGVGQRTTFRR